MSSYTRNLGFNRTVFEEIAKSKPLGAEVIDGVLKRVSEIKEAAAKESEYLCHPDIEIQVLKEGWSQ